MGEREEKETCVRGREGGREGGKELSDAPHLHKTTTQYTYSVGIINYTRQHANRYMLYKTFTRKLQELQAKCKVHIVHVVFTYKVPLENLLQ